MYNGSNKCSNGTIYCIILNTVLSQHDPYCDIYPEINIVNIVLLSVTVTGTELKTGSEGISVCDAMHSGYRMNQGQSCMFYLAICHNYAIFLVNMNQQVFFRVSSSTRYIKEPRGIMGMGFLWAGRPCCHPIVHQFRECVQVYRCLHTWHLDTCRHSANPCPAFLAAVTYARLVVAN